ncbi:hypothetical protein BT96DRAFT_1000359 [Gymnopus androsaceus JB14]|uniref:Uncharacterized protein n=1 Tax=Gymnopus androsaceus JB14 TaxID=1447944 RepID=A0A6A4H2W8_9AGAR|nr:hypothetical protein BT96DRAFT_1000359 [Gymnopus androsaceus JB14]
MGNRKAAHNRKESRNNQPEEQKSSLWAATLASAAKQCHNSETNITATHSRSTHSSQSTRPLANITSVVNQPSSNTNSKPITPTSPAPKPPQSAAPKKRKALLKLESALCQICWLKKKVAGLKMEVLGLKNALAQEKKDKRKKLLEQTAKMKRQGYLRSEDRKDLWEKVYTLERKAAHYECINMLVQAQQKEQDASSSKFLCRGHGGAYSNKARELA